MTSFDEITHLYIVEGAPIKAQKLRFLPLTKKKYHFIARRIQVPIHFHLKHAYLVEHELMKSIFAFLHLIYNATVQKCLCMHKSFSLYLYRQMLNINLIYGKYLIWLFHK